MTKLFTYTGPHEEVDVIVRVKQGEQVGVPDDFAGRAYSEEVDDEGEVVSVDLGEGFLAQPDAWRPDEKALADMTVAELEGYAASASPPVDLAGVKKKADIIAAIESARSDSNDEKG